ncbi:hypothetical protein ACFQYP_21620 [Nonomuraea antimicrobica]
MARHRGPAGAGAGRGGDRHGRGRPRTARPPRPAPPWASPDAGTSPRRSLADLLGGGSRTSSAHRPALPELAVARAVQRAAALMGARARSAAPACSTSSFPGARPSRSRSGRRHGRTPPRKAC